MSVPRPTSSSLLSVTGYYLAVLEGVSALCVPRVISPLHLGIVVGTHVLKLDRVIETTDGRPIEWRVAFS
jgi:hypothetical protein